MTVAAAIPPMSFTGDYGTPVGAVDSLVGAELRDLPTWVWHGEQDQLVTVTIPRAMIATFRRAGMRYLRYTEVPRGRHDCLSAFSDSASMRWLVTQRRGAPTP
ncbi:MAG: hypothetical protein HY275_00235 [Gemmatimonadetes bacterium]|nr:hypothetical protein [Gemmatimonadota bacterium]